MGPQQFWLSRHTHTPFEILFTKHQRNNEILNDPVAKLLNLGKLLKIVIWQLINFSPATILEQKDSNLQSGLSSRLELASRHHGSHSMLGKRTLDGHVVSDLRHL